MLTVPHMVQQATDLFPDAKKKEAGQQSLTKIEVPLPRGRARFCAEPRSSFLAQVLSALLVFTLLPETCTQLGRYLSCQVVGCLC